MVAFSVFAPMSCRTAGAPNSEVQNLHRYYTFSHILINRPYGATIRICGENTHLIKAAIEDWATLYRWKFNVVVVPCGGRDVAIQSNNINSPDFIKECEGSAKDWAFARIPSDPMRIWDCRAEPIDNARARTIFLHEIGHTFGLCDTYSQMDKTSWGEEKWMTADDYCVKEGRSDSTWAPDRVMKEAKTLTVGDVEAIRVAFELRHPGQNVEPYPVVCGPCELYDNSPTSLGTQTCKEQFPPLRLGPVAGESWRMCGPGTSRSQTGQYTPVSTPPVATPTRQPETGCLSLSESLRLNRCELAKVGKTPTAMSQAECDALAARERSYGLCK
jgi:hypothetical protein